MRFPLVLPALALTTLAGCATVPKPLQGATRLTFEVPEAGAKDANFSL